MDKPVVVTGAGEVFYTLILELIGMYRAPRFTVQPRMPR